MNGERQSVEAGYAWGWLALFLPVGFDFKPCEGLSLQSLPQRCTLRRQRASKTMLRTFARLTRSRTERP